MTKHTQSIKIFVFVVVALLLKFVVANRLLATGAWWWQALMILVIFTLGFCYVFSGTVTVVEETTDVLRDRTRLAGGLLQSFGTAFPDMIVGIVAAVLAFQVRSTDPLRAINLAVLAAAATFGSNIYNILHATWCVWRQNLADTRGKNVLMLPFVPSFGTLRPVTEHKMKPTVGEMNGAIRVLIALTLLTAFAAISMVIFGKTDGNIQGITGDMYKLITPVGILLGVLCIATLYIFRKNPRPTQMTPEVLEGESFYSAQPTFRIWFDLVLSGVAILFAAEAMVTAMEVFSHLTHLPFVVTGVMGGIIGCFGEMLIVHNFSVHPHGRIGDAIVGVAMDNIMTMLGASLVATIGGIFLGGSSLILIFIIILTANTVLIGQICELKGRLPRETLTTWR